MGAKEPQPAPNKPSNAKLPSDISRFGRDGGTYKGPAIGPKPPASPAPPPPKK
jgi:hypothetical protein